ncbi:right-handed parallel beta-helix repeat-containing protein [Microbacterium sp. NPDC055683]
MQEQLGVYLPELHALEGDRDDQAIRRAAIAASKVGGGTVLLTRSLYRLSAPIALNGLRNIVFESRSGSVITSAGPADRLFAFQGSADTIGADGEPLTDQGARNVEIRGLVFDGGLTNGDDLDDADFYDFNADGERVASGKGQFARDARAYAGSGDQREGLMRALYVLGDAEPTVEDAPVFTNISVSNVRLLGLEDLPIYLRGVRGLAAVDDSYAYRCLDIGFTNCENVRFNRNRIEYSADNGVSISRGNRNVTCSGNIIVKSYYFGIHLGGFAGQAGPRNVSCTGNTIVQSGSIGINLYEGPRDITITGNFISDIHRGSDDKDVTASGFAILIRGGDSGTAIARNIVIVGNNITRPHRAGVAIARNAEDVLISGNSFQRIGLPRTPGGEDIPPNSVQANFAIGKPGDATLHAASVNRVIATANAVFEDRGAMLENLLVRTVWRGGADLNAVANYASFNERSKDTAGAIQPTTMLPSTNDVGAPALLPPGSLAYDEDRRIVVVSDGDKWRKTDGSLAES